MKLGKIKQMIIIALIGAICGGGILFLYMLRAYSYLSDAPEVCLNCHIMTPYYATWMHSSHGRNTTCNDCHLPHESFAGKWIFKSEEGARHVTVFLTRGEVTNLRAIPASSKVIMDNCIRCHTMVNSMITEGRIDYMQAKAGEGHLCWDCHKSVPHSGNVSLTSTPNAIVSLPESPSPEWLRNLIINKEK